MENIEINQFTGEGEVNKKVHAQINMVKYLIDKQNIKPEQLTAPFDNVLNKMLENDNLINAFEVGKIEISNCTNTTTDVNYRVIDGNEELYVSLMIEEDNYTLKVYYANTISKKHVCASINYPSMMTNVNNVENLPSFERMFFESFDAINFERKRN